MKKINSHWLLERLFLSQLMLPVMWMCFQCWFPYRKKVITTSKTLHLNRSCLVIALTSKWSLHFNPKILSCDLPTTRVHENINTNTPITKYVTIPPVDESKVPRLKEIEYKNIWKDLSFRVEILENNEKWKWSKWTV